MRAEARFLHHEAPALPPIGQVTIAAGLGVDLLGFQKNCGP